MCTEDFHEEHCWKVWTLQDAPSSKITGDLQGTMEKNIGVNLPFNY